LMKRIHGNYNFIIGFNAMLIALGLAGIMTPSNSALFHNISTIATGLKSMTPLIPEEEIEADKEEVLEAGKRRKKALAKKKAS
jgi:P-ATPase family cation transporter